MLAATLVYGVLLISCQSASLDSFVITPSNSASDGLGTLQVTMNWKNSSYECSFSPSDLSPLTCDSSVWNEISIPADIYVPYHFKFEWFENASPFIFDSIVITDAVFNVYNITNFCIRLVYTHTHTSFM